MPRQAAAKSTRSLSASTRIAVLHGPEETLIRRHLDTLRAALTKEYGEVESFTFDGATATLSDVLDEVRSYSLMGTYKIVVVNEADQFVKNHRPVIERYAQQPVDHATLVLRATTWRPSNLDKMIAKVGGVIKCDTLTASQARDELVRRAKSEYDRTLSPAAATQLVQRLGRELLKLDTELAKLALMVEPGQAIGPALIDQTVGRTSDEEAYMVHDAILNAMQSGSAGHAIEKIHELVDLSGQAETLVTYFVIDMIRKLNVAIPAHRAGVPEPVIAKEVKIWGPKMRPFFAAVRQLDLATAGRLLDEAVKMDADAKSGVGEPMINLECFCVRLADKMGGKKEVVKWS